MRYPDKDSWQKWTLCNVGCLDPSFILQAGGYAITYIRIISPHHTSLHFSKTPTCHVLYIYGNFKELHYTSIFYPSRSVLNEANPTGLDACCEGNYCLLESRRSLHRKPSMQLFEASCPLDGIHSGNGSWGEARRSNKQTRSAAEDSSFVGVWLCLIYVLVSLVLGLFPSTPVIACLRTTNYESLPSFRFSLARMTRCFQSSDLLRISPPQIITTLSTPLNKRYLTRIVQFVACDCEPTRSVYP